MSTLIRYGQPIKISEIRQKLKDFGTCLKFDGSSAYVSLGSSDPLSGNNFYISMWVKWYGSTGLYQHLFAKRNSYGATTMVFDLAIKDTNGNIVADTANASLDSGYVLPVGKWVHLCYVHDGRDKLYIDCQMEYSTTNRILGTGTTTEMVIGATNTSKSEFFNGEIDEFVIGIGNPTWKDVVAIKSQYKYTSDANSEGVFYPYINYNFDESSGTTAIDSTTNALNGTITNATYSTNVAVKNRP